MRIRVVLADDFPLVREGVSRALDADPAIEVVGKAGDGQQALGLAESLQPDVMILDLRMPDLGGLEVLDKLRTSRPEIRVIVMTASEQASTLLDAVAAGAAGYLSKRSTGQELRHAVITAQGAEPTSPASARRRAGGAARSSRAGPSSTRSADPARRRTGVSHVLPHIRGKCRPPPRRRNADAPRETRLAWSAWRSGWPRRRAAPGPRERAVASRCRL